LVIFVTVRFEHECANRTTTTTRNIKAYNNKNNSIIDIGITTHNKDEGLLQMCVKCDQKPDVTKQYRI